VSEPIPVSIDPDLADLIPRYLESRREDVERITAALASGGWDTIRRLGHSMRGMGASYGFQRITDFGGAIEDAAPNQDRGAVEATLASLADYLQRVEPTYD
jgi:HPt (histidine-containing phosphotransfer) domain-containing protein